MQIDFKNVQNQLLNETTRLINFLNEQEIKKNQAGEKFLKINMDDLEERVSPIRDLAIAVASIKDESGNDVLGKRIVPFFPELDDDDDVPF